MGKQRSSLRQVPWQSWEHWNWVATELFSDSSERVSGVLDRIAAWQSRGKVPIAVETSAAIIGIHQRDPQVNHGIPKESALPEEMLRMMYAMAIQRLVNGVVDQSQKRNTTSVADRADFAGLPRLLVDVRHEAAHTELPGLPLLQVASKQCAYAGMQNYNPNTARVWIVHMLGCNIRTLILRGDKSIIVEERDRSTGIFAGPSFQRQTFFNVLSTAICGPECLLNLKSRIHGPVLLLQALAWLKLQYWDQQKETLVNVRLELKSKLVEHCRLVVDILNPSATAADQAEQESDSKSEELHEVVPQETLRVKKQQRKGLFNELLGLSLSSMSNLISTLVDDGLLEQDTLPMEEEVHSKQPVRTGCSDGPDLTSATDSAWKLTLRDLSAQLPRLPEMLLVAIIKHINKSFPGSGALRKPEEAGPTVAQAPDRNIDESTDSGSTHSLQRKRLISWCAWLLGKRSVHDSEGSSEKEPQKSKLMKISNSLFVRANLSKELLADLLRLCLSTSNGQEPLVDLVSLISVQLGSERFQHRVAALAQLGTSMQRLHRNAMDTSENQGANATTVVEERPLEGSFEKVTASSPAAGDNSSLGSQSTMEPALEIARRQQRAFLARLSSQKKDVQSSSESLRREEQSADSPLILPNGTPSPPSWTVVENWRPCAIGMIPSACHSIGILPTLDVYKHAHGTERVVRKVPGGISSEETSATTNAAGKPVDENNLATAGRVEPVEGKRMVDEQLDVSRGSKLQKTGRHVHFEDEGPVGVDKEGVVNPPGVSSKSSMIPDQAVGHQKEQNHTGSLVQGCLLQQGMFMPVTPEQLESLKTAVHVL